MSLAKLKIVKDALNHLLNVQFASNLLFRIQMVANVFVLLDKARMVKEVAPFVLLKIVKLVKIQSLSSVINAYHLILYLKTNKIVICRSILGRTALLGMGYHHREDVNHVQLKIVLDASPILHTVPFVFSLMF